MAVLYIRAAYTEEEKLQEFLLKLFGRGNYEIEWARGRWQCTVPRELRSVCNCWL
ncbi:hypothetical protein F5B22DRAFT_622341 [Xylaria bambusicola]|uniref:uncharacterized protein n=1 Tax=Xylaria bambusicola TaxID=326684 RepID=UPI002007AFDE|nr:uncharacterized protein F5B22DRAFT_622341 [Xylaria bambusicola]KAI0506867.1 hypothetical protein F5B22DRAFT_622341 [Xylaria bambusicola]